MWWAVLHTNNTDCTKHDCPPEGVMVDPRWEGIQTNYTLWGAIALEPSNYALYTTYVHSEHISELEYNMTLHNDLFEADEGDKPTPTHLVYVWACGATRVVTV